MTRQEIVDSAPYQELVAAKNAVVAEAHEYRAALSAAEARVAALRVALSRYGRHEQWCGVRMQGLPPICTCGFQAALDAAGGEKK